MFTPAELAADPNATAIRFRCHSLAELMSEPKNKSDVLSVGAKTHVKKLVKEALFGVRAKLDNKFIKKGLECEQESIDLLNEVYGGGFVKNTVRQHNEWLTGEPDIVAVSYGVDIKTSWSIDTFPLTPEDGMDKTYEWQARAYMLLFDKDKWDIAYCLVDTPQHLIGYEDPAIHIVSHIDPRMRVTVARYYREADKEEAIKVKCAAAQKYYAELMASIKESRGVSSVFVGQPTSFKQSAKAAFSTFA